MALAVHRHGRCEEDEDVYAGADTPGMEVVSAGSVTSFVRKLFQMVQGECDSIVGFVADGTAFEVKDPRRLEQDILPKYFRHSRFQSLVRQLNFYSFKKISKERSVWIYKHAFFRRDEPELLHALKRKTNQHGTPGPIGRVAVGGGADGDDMMAGRSPVVDRSLSRDARDSDNPRSRGPMFLPRHRGSPGSDFPPQHHHSNHPHPHHTSSPSFTSHQHPFHGASGRTHPRPPQHLLSTSRKSGGGNGRAYHTSSSRSTGGGPSTGGGAVPSYGGQGPSSRGGSGTPGGWAGAGGRPVSSGGGQAGSGSEYERRNGGGGSMAHHQGYRQGPAMGDTGGERGAHGQHGGNRGPATGGAAASSDKEQALAIWGLSALCQVASSATEAPLSLIDDETRGRATGTSRRLSDDRGRQQQKRHRGAGPASTAARGRREWGVRDDESSGGEEDEEEDVTSAERDDSSSSIHRRSPSNSSCASSSSSSFASSADSTHSNPRCEGRQTTAVDRGNNEEDMPTTMIGTRVGTQQRQQQQHRASGSGGVFCPTWDWGRAACEPAIRLPGSFVDRRFEEVDEQVGNGVEMDDVDEESSKTEEEDMGEDQEEDVDEEDEEQALRKSDAKKAARAEKTTRPVEVSPSLAETPSTAPVASTPESRDQKADMEAEAEVGLEGIGALFNQFCSGQDGGNKPNTNASKSVYLATVTNSGDGGLREISVFCAGPAGKAPDEASPTSLVRQVSLFLQSEVAVAQDLRVYAEALDPAAVDVVVGRTKHSRQGGEQDRPLSTDGAKLLRVFCRYAACRLGRALEVASCAAEAEAPPGGDASDADDMEKAARQMLLRQSAVARRITPRLDECRWKWWRAAVRFS